MKESINIGIYAAILSLALHFVVVSGVLVPRIDHGVLNKENVLQVQLGPSVKEPKSISQKIESEIPVARRELNNAEGDLQLTQDASSPSSSSISTDNEWWDILPHLSNTPLPPLYPPFITPSTTPVDQKLYIPAGDLDVRPKPKEPIIIPFPDGSLHKQKGTAILILFIGVDGKVDHVDIDKSDLPPEFEKAAIDTFMQAQMLPGIKDGNPIPSRTKIEVIFEAR